MDSQHARGSRAMLPLKNDKDKWCDLVQFWHSKICYYQPKSQQFSDKSTTATLNCHICLLGGSGCAS